LFFFYVRSARTGASKCELGFIGPYMVMGHYVSSPNNSTVNARKPSGKFAVIIGFKNGNHSVGFVPMDSAFNALSFITNKARTGRGGWQDHVQFSIISIREEDYNTLLSNRLTQHDCIDHLKSIVKSNCMF